MADDVTVDNGALTDYVVSTDEGAGGHVQRVKLAYSADGSETHVEADAYGLKVNPAVSKTVTGTLTNPADVVSLSCAGYGSAMVFISGTYADASIAAEVSHNGTDWVLTTAISSLTGQNMSNYVVANNNAAHAFFLPLHGAAYCRVLLSTITSGSVAVTISAVHGSTILPPGAVGESPLFVQPSEGGFGVQVTSEPQYQHVEDAAAADGDTGVAVLAVRRDTPSSGVDTDGDYATINVDELGYLHTATPRVAAATVTTVDSSASTTSLLAANTARRGCHITNTDANTLRIKYGATASATSFTVPIPTGGYWEMPAPIYTGAIDGIWDADGAGKAIITEL
jgi:hypothetical protein